MNIYLRVCVCVLYMWMPVCESVYLCVRVCFHACVARSAGGPDQLAISEPLIPSAQAGQPSNQDSHLETNQGPRCDVTVVQLRGSAGAGS